MASLALNKPTPHVCRNRHVMVVCTGESCRNAGATDLLHDLKHHHEHASGDLRIGESKCIHRCQAAPAMIEDGRVMGWMSRMRLKIELLRLGLLN
ncbi:NAD(P)H-dependent oxidoreductase subunit E [Paludibaculum fermentans]|uniref:NAD(P)H-dependent oxidoreductase subunit E n=1 Tax=Paludibaculum fermentans TaxID=1473598 RepID=UPI003EBFF357